MGARGRCSLTVVLRSGVRLDALMATPTEDDHTGRPGLSFLCSGRMVWYPAHEIAAVEFFAGPSLFCGVCEQPLGGC